LEREKDPGAGALVGLEFKIDLPSIKTSPCVMR
jgi:hypothetical protein